MARAHTEFIHEQVVAWSDGSASIERPGTQARLLSVDDETGALTAVVRYPRGWERPGAETLPMDEEFFVLDGSLIVNGVTHDRLSYGFHPAGHVWRSSRSDDGALVLTFRDSAPTAGPADGSAEPIPRLVERVHALDGEWGGGFHPQFPPGAGRKYLREDPVSHEQTWLLGTMPLRSGRRPEKHPISEEMFLLAGEVISPIGRMHPGAYFWRPPEIWHGPYGSTTGSLYLFRTKGGPLSTVYTEVEQDLDWDPPHAPVLPATLADVGGVPYRGMPEF